VKTIVFPFSVASALLSTLPDRELLPKE